MNHKREGISMHTKLSDLVVFVIPIGVIAFSIYLSFY